MRNLRLTTASVPLAALAVLLVCARVSLGIEIHGVQEAALDLPRVNAVIQPAEGGDPYSYENIFGGESINISPFLDTGSSGVIVSVAFGDAMELPTEGGVTFFDVGVGGATEFDVTPPLNVRIARSTSLEVDNPDTFMTVYDQAYGPMRLAVGPTNVSPDPVSDPLNVFGMPVMMGKTVVIDPKPLNDLSDFLHTFIYEPGTPFVPELANEDPGIPSTSHQVKLSYGDFERFTETTPPGAEPPLLNHNPFIGPNPLLQLQDNPPVDNTPPVEVAFSGLRVSGSFLFDTGAAASFISTGLAAAVNVRYSDELGGDPQLEIFDPENPELPGTVIENQFLASIQGIGGVVTLAGFYLDEMLLYTLQGSLDPNDPNNIRYVGAPMLVGDITVLDPVTLDSLTLDGVFGMNFLVASIALDFGDARESAFNWITFDEPTGILGLDLVEVPEPSSIAMALCGLIALAGYAWRRRQRRK